MLGQTTWEFWCLWRTISLVLMTNSTSTMVSFSIRCQLPSHYVTSVKACQTLKSNDTYWKFPCTFALQISQIFKCFLFCKGPNGTYPKTADGLCGKAVATHYSTSQRYAYVRMTSDASVELAGLLVEYVAAKDYCKLVRVDWLSICQRTTSFIFCVTMTTNWICV